MSYGLNTFLTHAVPPAPVQMTAAPTDDDIAVSWRWNGSSYSVLTCVRNLRIIYQPVGEDKNKSFDIPKSSTNFTFRGQQCNVGCAIIIRSVDVNGTNTEKECTTSGRNQIWPKTLFTKVYLW